ncbi:2499_t:CDS:2 [Ambispora gerdemannii]|uniref:2499_t:CDS:1 n=1 Tax=Ambispora gerdemannii TaxID=144530 RepID=A0A9N8ZQL2_9GLOM|nr:2499_t:CDS:2 [Ambispora gerdemannii]
MGRIRRSRTHKGNKDHSKKYRTRKYTKDLDQIHDDLLKLEGKNSSEKLHQGQEQPPHDIDPDLPGLGQHYCIACARYFIDANALTEHYRGKWLIHVLNLAKHIHSALSAYSPCDSDRIKLLKEAPYTQVEAEAAVGLTTENVRVRLMDEIVV